MTFSSSIMADASVNKQDPVLASRDAAQSSIVDQPVVATLNEGPDASASAAAPPKAAAKYAAPSQGEEGASGNNTQTKSGGESAS